MLPLLLAAALSAPSYPQDTAGLASGSLDRPLGALGGGSAPLVSSRPSVAGARRIGGPPPGLYLGLVGSWSFDEGGGDAAADGSANALDGVVYGATWTAGRVGSALAFDGNSYVEVPDAPALRITEDITIAAWVFKDAPNDGQRWDAILAKCASNAWDYELLTSQSKSDEPAFYSDLTTPTEVYAGTPLASGSWRHVAVTRAGATASFFVDGVLVGSEPMDGTFASTSKPLRIGHDFLRGMIGKLDEVMLYDRALTAAELRYLAGESKRIRQRMGLGLLHTPEADGQVEEVNVWLPASLTADADASVWFLVRPTLQVPEAGEVLAESQGWIRAETGRISYRARRAYAGRSFTLGVVAVDGRGSVLASDTAEVRFQR